MTGTAQRVGQAIALIGVVALLGLLVWKVAFDREGGAAAQLGKVPCRDEAPVLQQTYERYRDRGLVVLGVDVNDFRQDARGFMERYGVTYPVVYDGKGSTVGKWGVRAFPETFFVDRSGKLVGERIAGAVDIERNRAAFERGVALALGETP